eukprot:13142169-Ditylum_brightwellii.AAC.1
MQTKEQQQTGIKNVDRSEVFKERATRSILDRNIQPQTKQSEEMYQQTGMLDIKQYKMVDKELHTAVMDAADLLPPVEKDLAILERKAAISMEQYGWGI